MQAAAAWPSWSLLVHPPPSSLHPKHFQSCCSPARNTTGSGKSLSCVLQPFCSVQLQGQHCGQALLAAWGRCSCPGHSHPTAPTAGNGPPWGGRTIQNPRCCCCCTGNHESTRINNGTETSSEVRLCRGQGTGSGSCPQELPSHTGYLLPAPSLCPAGPWEAAPERAGS